MRNRIVPSRGGLRKAVMPPPSPGPARREQRVPLGAEGWISFDAERHSIALLDLSAHGFGARAGIEIPIGSQVTVWLPAYGEVRAQIRWSLCGFFGGLFLDRGIAAGWASPDNMEVAGDGQPA